MKWSRKSSPKTKIDPAVGQVEEPGDRVAHAVEQPPAGLGAQDQDREHELKRGAEDDGPPVDATAVGRERPGDREEGQQPEYALQLLHRGSRRAARRAPPLASRSSARYGMSRPAIVAVWKQASEPADHGAQAELGELRLALGRHARRCRRSGSRSTRSWRSRTGRRWRSPASARRARRPRPCRPSWRRRRTRWRRS